MLRFVGLCLIALLCGLILGLASGDEVLGIKMTVEEGTALCRVTGVALTCLMLTIMLGVAHNAQMKGRH